MTSSIALSAPRLASVGYPARKPAAPRGRATPPGPSTRISLLVLVVATHMAALWAISRTSEPLETAVPMPLAVTFVEIAQPVVEAPPPPRPQVVTPPAPRAVKQPPSRAKPVPPKPIPDETPQAPVDAPSSVQPESAPAMTSMPAVASQTQDSGARTNDSLAEPARQPVSEAARFDAAYLNNPAPAYPALARRLGEEGTVRLRVWVTRDGRAGKVELARSTGSPRLDRTALETVSRWRFEPARENGTAIEQWVIVPIKFKLENHER